MEDGHSGWSYESAFDLRIMVNPSQYWIPFKLAISLDANTYYTIEKDFGHLKQALHRWRREPSTEADMMISVVEELTPQEWIDSLIN